MNCAFLTLLCLFISFSVAATETKFKDFKFKEGYAVFIDFQKAEYNVEIDFDNKTAFITSHISFHQDKDGYPIFDLHNTIIDIHVDQNGVNTSKVSPPGSKTSVIIVDNLLKKGFHQLVVKSNLDEVMMRLNFDLRYLDYDFLFSDLDDRNFLELYAVSSFEYDQVEMSFEFAIIGSNSEHEIYTNGNVVNPGNNRFKIAYPHYFTTSSIYLHIFKKNLHIVNEFNYQSVTGRNVPVKIYVAVPHILSNDPDLLEWSANEAKSVLKELETVIGPWPHPELLINMDGGGMEAHGAAHASRESLRHEIIHSYFGRGVMPLDGQSSWVDESLTYWIDVGYPESNVCTGWCIASLSQYSPYLRHTPDNQIGFSSFLNQRLSSKGGLKKFLPYFFSKYKFKLITTEIFKKELEDFYDENLDLEFNMYVYE